MQYTTQHTKDFLVVTLSGRLTHQAHPAFAELIGVISKAGDRHVIVDVGGIDYIDSTGFGMFVVACETSQKGGGVFRVRNASDQLKEMAGRIRADHIMRID